MTQARLLYESPDNADCWLQEVGETVKCWIKMPRTEHEIDRLSQISGRSLIYLPDDFPVRPIVTEQFLTKNPLEFEAWYQTQPLRKDAIIFVDRVSYGETDDWYDIIDGNGVHSDYVQSGDEWYVFTLEWYSPSHYIQIEGERVIPQSWGLITNSLVGHLSGIWEKRYLDRPQAVFDALVKVWGSDIGNLHETVKTFLGED